MAVSFSLFVFPLPRDGEIKFNYYQHAIWHRQRLAFVKKGSAPIMLTPYELVSTT